jgi:PKD repeat protein
MRRVEEEVLLAIIVVLLINLTIIPRINIGTAQTEPNIYVSPSSILDPSIVVGGNFTIDLMIIDAENIYGWQLNMTYNPVVVNTTKASITQGNFLQDYGPTVFAKDVDNVGGSLLVGCTFQPPYPPDGAYGEGVLASITFKVKAVGATLLHFAKNTKLRTYAGGTLVEITNFATKDGSFDNRVSNVPPVASFAVLPFAPEQRGVVNFDASASYDPDDWLTSYQWDYGDNTSDTYIRNVNLTHLTTHIYAQNGTYPVTLTVKDNWNQTASAAVQVIVLYDVAVTSVNSPQVVATPRTPVLINVTVVNNGDFLEDFTVTTYFNQSKIAAQNVTNLAPKTPTTLTFTWNTTDTPLGNYMLKANATIVPGEANTANNEYTDGLVSIAETNIVNYPVIVGGKTFIVQVNSTSTLPASINLNSAQKKIRLTISGEEGTGAFCNATVPMALLNVSIPNAWILNLDGNPQAYTVTQNGAHYFLYFTYTHSTHSIEIIGETVATPPIALFTTSTTKALAGESIFFNATASYDPDGNYPLTYTWDFKDGNTDSGITVEHAFDSYGTYNVILTVKDSEDLANSTQVAITIIDYPTANFTLTPKVPIANQLVTFDATISQANGGTITSYAWDFNDGQTNTTAIVMHKYSSAGNYTVTLTVVDDELLSNSTTKVIRVTDYPVANFTYTPLEPLVDHTITFNATDSQANGGIIKNYAWNFGDEQTKSSTNAIATHSYTKTGAFLVKLTVTDSEELDNSTTRTVVVRIHNIAITSVTTSKSRARIGDTFTVTIRVANQGNYTETFNITAYYNTTSIGTTTVPNLGAGKTQFATITWDTTGVSAGIYTIKAEATTVVDETRKDDNQLLDEDTVTIEQKESTLIITASSPVITMGENTTISGTLTPALQDITITIHYKPQDETTWNTLPTTMTTDANGQYRCIWAPSTVGKYQIKAGWQGNSATQPCESPEQTVIVFEAEEPQQQTSTDTILYIAGAIAVISIIAGIINIVVVGIYIAKIRKQRTNMPNQKRKNLIWKIHSCIDLVRG